MTEMPHTLYEPATMPISEAQAYLDGELTAERREAFEEQLQRPATADWFAAERESHEALQRRMGSLVQAEAEVSLPDPQVQLEALLRRQKQQVQRTSTQPPQKAPWYEGFWSFPLWLGTPIAAAAMLLLLTPPNLSTPLSTPTGTPTGTHTRSHKRLGLLRAKGMHVSFSLLYQEPQAMRRPGKAPKSVKIAKKGQVLRPGSLVQFQLKLPRNMQGMIISINNKGEIFPFVPFRGTWSQPMDAGKRFYPPRSSLELDDYIGTEQFVVVVAKKPFSYRQLRRELARQQRKGTLKLDKTLQLSAPFVTKSIIIHKAK